MSFLSTPEERWEWVKAHKEMFPSLFPPPPLTGLQVAWKLTKWAAVVIAWSAGLLLLLTMPLWIG